MTEDGVFMHGTLPPPRFGHTMTQITPSLLVLFGGATGSSGHFEISGESYLFSQSDSSWLRITKWLGPQPSPRAAHAACSPASSELLVYGGATGGGTLASDDLYHLTIHTFPVSWSILPIVSPTPGRRYGHSLTYMKPFLILYGGNSGSETLGDVWTLNLQISPYTWCRIDPQIIQPQPRAYHSSVVCPKGSAAGMMVIFGGRGEDASALSDTWGLRAHNSGKWSWLRAPISITPSARYQHTSLFLGSQMIIIGGRSDTLNREVPIESYNTETGEWKKLQRVLRFRHASWASDECLFLYGGFRQSAPNIPTNDLVKVPLDVKKRRHSKSLDIRLSDQVSINLEDLDTVTDISIDRLQEEGKRLGIKALPPGRSIPDTPEHTSEDYLKSLMRSSEWASVSPPTLDKENTLKLINACKDILTDEAVVLRLRAPVKVFGNICGQFAELLRLFDLWADPEGDLECFDYLFLGDYVDRGTSSLDTICLLMSLKLKYPQQVFLLRGHHEDEMVNRYCGLAFECAQTFNEDVKDVDSVFQTLNSMFEYLPLAAVINDSILAVHGGFGTSFVSLKQIERLVKPVCVRENPEVIDLLWGDLAENELECGFKENTYRDTCGYANVVKFGNDKIKEFLEVNQLKMIIRSHECAIDGFDINKDRNLVTVFSVTDYCGKYKNAAALLIIKRNLEIVPKLMQPLKIPVNRWRYEGAITPPRWRNTCNFYN